MEMKKLAAAYTVGLVVLILVIAGCAAPTTATKSVVTGANADENTIIAFFAGLEKAWNGKDPEAYKSYWMRDGVFVNREGKEFLTRREPNRSMLRRMEKETEKYKVTKISLKEDKAQVLVEFSSNGRELDLVFDLVKQDGQWKIMKRDIQ